MSAPATTELLANRDAFRAFLVSRLGNEADAEDILQNGLVKALRRAPELRDDTRITAWFFEILRNAILDHVRSRTAAVARERAWSSEREFASGADDERALCRCFEPLLAGLKPRHATLLRRVELDGCSVAATAAELGLNANQASVALHRARVELRAKLESVCGECATGACLDCDCPPPADPAGTPNPRP